MLRRHMLPWRFDKKPPIILIPLKDIFEEELSHLKDGFAYAIRNTMNSLAVSDTDFLEQVLEPTLFAKYCTGYTNLKNMGLNMSLVNQDSAFQIKMYNEELHCGVNLNRNKNGIGKYKIQSIPSIWSGKEKVDIDSMHFYGGGKWDSNIILKVDIVCESSCKFVLTNQNNDVVVGDNSDQTEVHKFRFECVTERHQGFFYQFKSSLDVLKYFIFNKGVSPLKLDNWFITDIDDAMNTNPFLIR